MIFKDRRLGGVFTIEAFPVTRWFAAAFVLVVFALHALPVSANILSAEDERVYKKAFAALKERDYEEAQKWAAKAREKLPAKAVKWAYYSAASSGATFGEITAFVRENPTWPQIPTLLRRAEEAITIVTPPAAVVEWFDVYPPQTVDGALAYGKALIAAGKVEKARPIVRRAWINGGFGLVQEREFYAAFQDLLTPADHWDRLDRLLWDDQNQDAARQMSRVDEGHRALAQARLALATNAGNADQTIARVPDSLRADPGLIFERLHYRRVNDMDEEAMALLDHPSRNQVRPSAWWTERAILTRRALQRGDAATAYKIASDHGLTEGAPFADAEWMSGWIALRFINKPDVALAHFARLYERVQTPQSRSRGSYWAGRAAEALGRASDAQRWYLAAQEYVTTFYGQLAAARAGRDQQWPLPADPLPSASDIDFFERHELVRVARMLGELQETDLVRPFMLRMNDLAHGPGQRALAANLATRLGRSDIAVAVAKRSEREGVPLIASGYPIPPIAAVERPERALVLGLIRQESAFQYEAVSSAGARGLMQLMPATASKLAKDMGLTFKKKEVLNEQLTGDPSLNVRLGSAFLDGLIDDFNGSYVLAIASYNAGPSRVRRWVRDMGDPRSPEIDVIDWIESIPFPETRNYTQRVLEGLQIYRRRLAATGLALSLDADLKRTRQP